MERFGLGFVGCGGYARSLADAAARSDKLLPLACWDVVPPAVGEALWKLGCAIASDAHATRTAANRGLQPGGRGRCMEVSCVLIAKDAGGSGAYFLAFGGGAPSPALRQ